MKRTVSGLLVMMAVAVGCDGPLADDSAATVDGVDIGIDAVRELAAAKEVVDQAGIVEGAVTLEKGEFGAASARFALGYLVRTELLAAANRWVGLDNVVPPSASDADGQGLSAEAARAQSRFDAYGQALATESPDDEVLDAFLRARADAVGSGVCLEGVGVPTDSAGAMAELLATGASFGEIAAQLSTQVQVVGTEDQPTCVGLTALPDPALEELLARGALGEIGTVEMAAPTGGTTTFFLRPLSRGARAWAASEFATPETSASAWIGAMGQLVDIEIDPRFGDLDVDQMTVVPPERPAARDAATLLGA